MLQVKPSTKNGFNFSVLKKSLAHYVCAYNKVLLYLPKSFGGPAAITDTMPVLDTGDVPGLRQNLNCSPFTIPF